MSLWPQCRFRPLGSEAYAEVCYSMPETPLPNVLLDFLGGTNARVLHNITPDNLRKLETFLRGLKADIRVPGQRPGRAKTIKAVIPKVGRETFVKVDKATGQSCTTTVQVRNYIQQIWCFSKLSQDHFWEVHRQTIKTDELGVRCGGGEYIPIR